MDNTSNTNAQPSAVNSLPPLPPLPDMQQDTIQIPASPSVVNTNEQIQPSNNADIANQTQVVNEALTQSPIVSQEIINPTNPADLQQPQSATALSETQTPSNTNVEVKNKGFDKYNILIGLFAVVLLGLLILVGYLIFQLIT